MQWPVITHGMHYNGKPITIGEDLGLDFPLSQTVRPVVDFTPAPALSNFTFHRGDRFPRWERDLLVGPRVVELWNGRVNRLQVEVIDRVLDGVQERAERLSIRSGAS